MFFLLFPYFVSGERRNFGAKTFVPLPDIWKHFTGLAKLKKRLSILIETAYKSAAIILSIQ
jgi:hypothetical protein